MNQLLGLITFPCAFEDITFLKYVYILDFYKENNVYIAFQRTQGRFTELGKQQQEYINE